MLMIDINSKAHFKIKRNEKSNHIQLTITYSHSSIPHLCINCLTLQDNG